MLHIIKVYNIISLFLFLSPKHFSLGLVSTIRLVFSFFSLGGSWLLTHCVLTHCVLTHCVLTHCVLTHCVLTHCVLTHGVLTHVS